MPSIQSFHIFKIQNNQNYFKDDRKRHPEFFLAEISNWIENETKLYAD